MGQIPTSMWALIGPVIAVITATIAQRKWGSKGRLWVWLASAVIITGTTLSPLFYNYGLPSTRQELFAVAFLLIPITLGSGVVVWAVAFWVALVEGLLAPRAQQTSSIEVNYFPFNMPTGTLGDTDGLAGIVWRYHELLATFMTSLDSALASTLLNPYQPILRGFLKSCRIYSESFRPGFLPSFLQQARAFSRQFARAPNALLRDLAGADVVLAELETLTAAQLSAIEECHRVNVRRLRQRSVFRLSWSGGIAILGSALVSLTAAVEKVGGVKPSDFWPLIRGINLTGADPQSDLIRAVIFGLAIGAIALIANFITFLPILRRVHAFEDILAIAKAYRTGRSETTKPSAEPPLTVTG